MKLLERLKLFLYTAKWSLLIGGTIASIWTIYCAINYIPTEGIYGVIKAVLAWLLLIILTLLSSAATNSLDNLASRT